MRKFYTLLSREVSSYFYSPIAYIVLFFFLFVSGADFYFQISFMNQRPVQYSVQEAFFNSVFFWFAFVLIFPLITMRTFAEEFKLGTIEPLDDCASSRLAGGAGEILRGYDLLRGSLGPHSGLLRDLPIRHAPDRGRIIRRLLGFLFDAAVTGNVLHQHRLLRFCANEEPNYRRCNFVLRDHAALFLRPNYFHRNRGQFDDAASPRLFLGP